MDRLIRKKTYISNIEADYIMLGVKRLHCETCGRDFNVSRVSLSMREYRGECIYCDSTCTREISGVDDA